MSSERGGAIARCDIPGVKEILGLRSQKRVKALAEGSGRLGHHFLCFPELQSGDICEKLATNKESLSNLLRKTKFHFQYSREIVEDARKNLGTKPELAVSVITLQFFWKMSVDEVPLDYSDFIHVVNECLMYVLGNQKEFRSFLMCLAFLVKHGWRKTDKREDLCETLKHFENNQILCSTAPDLLVTVILELMNHKERDSFVGAVLSILQNHGVELKRNQKAYIRLRDSLIPFVQAFDGCALKIWVLLNQSVGSLPKVLCNVFRKREPIIQRHPRAEEFHVDSFPDLEKKTFEGKSRFASGFQMCSLTADDPLIAVFRHRVPSELDAVSEALVYLETSQKEKFFQNFKQTLEEYRNDPHYFDFLAFFLYCLKDLYCCSFVGDLKNVILDPDLFHSGVTVFGPVVISEQLRFLRKAAVMTLRQFPIHYEEFLLANNRSPFLFTELLTYAPDFAILYKETSMIPVANCCAVLRSLEQAGHSELLEKARSCCFAVLCRIFLFSFGSYACFDYFMRFAYELSVRKPFLYVFRHSINTSKSCDNLDRVFDFIKASLIDCDYDFVSSLVLTTALLFRKRPYLEVQVERFFDVLLLVVEKFPTEELILCALEVMENVKEMEPRHLIILKKAICGYDTSRLYDDFLKALGRTNNISSEQTGYLIRRPCVLQAIVIVYGFRRTVLQLLHMLSRVSIHNIVLMHDYCICDFLIDAIQGGRLSYKGTTFDVSLDDSNTAVEIVSRICSIKMSLPVFKKLLLHRNTVTIIDAIYTHYQANPDMIPVRTLRTSVCLRPDVLPKNCFDGPFAFTFWLCADYCLMAAIEESVNVFTVRGKSLQFGLQIKRGTMYAFMESSVSRTEVIVYRDVLASGQWCHFSINFDNEHAPFIINNYINGERPASSDFAKIKLEPGDLRFEIGGSRLESDVLCMILSELRVYDRNLEQEEVRQIYTHSHYSPSNCHVLKMDTNSCLPKQGGLEGIGLLLSMPNVVKKMLKYLPKQSDKHISYVILRLLSVSASLIDYDFAPFLLYLQNQIRPDDMIITFDLMHSIYSNINKAQVKAEWAQKILMNAGIWISSPQFHSILLKWELIISNQCDQFKKSTIFDELIEPMAMVKQEDFPLYTKVLSLVPTTSSCIASLVKNLASNGEESWRMKAYVFLIREIAASIVTHGAIIWLIVDSLMSYLGVNDLEIVYQTLLTISELTGSNFQRLALDCVRKIRNEFFLPLLDRIEGDQRTDENFNIMCILSMITKVPIVIDLETRWRQSDGIWYFLPLLLGFLSEDSFLMCILEKVSKSLRDLEEFQNVLILYMLLSSGIRRPRGHVLREFLSCYYHANKSNISSELFLDSVMTSIFFQLKGMSRGVTLEKIQSLNDVCALEYTINFALPVFAWSNFEKHEFKPDKKLIDLANEVQGNITVWKTTNIPNYVHACQRILGKIGNSQNSPQRSLKEFETFSSDMESMYIDFRDKLTLICTIISTGVRYDWDFMTHMMSGVSEKASALKEVHSSEEIIAPEPKYSYSRRLNALYMLNMIRKENKIPHAVIQEQNPNCLLVKGEQSWNARLEINTESIQICSRGKRYSFDLKEIRHVLVCDNRIEFFLYKGMSFILLKVPSKLIHLLKKTRVVLDTAKKVAEIQRKWSTGEMSTFEFLTNLTMVNGMTVTFLAESPVLPATIAMKRPESQIYWEAFTKREFDTSRTFTFVESETELIMSSCKSNKHIPELHKCEYVLDSEVPAGIYSFFDCPRVMSLPKLCDFVYTNRKMLEFDAKHVKKWAERRFSLHFRKADTIPPLSPDDKLASKDQVFLIGVPNSSRSGFLVYRNNEVYRDKTRLAVGNATVVQLNHGFGFYSRDTGMLRIVTSELDVVFSDPFRRPPVVAVDGQEIALMKTHCVVACFSGADAKPSASYLSPSPVEKIAISSRHHIMVLVCQDEKVRIRSLCNGKKIATVLFASESIQKVLITSELGFVLLATASRLFLLTPNGAPIKCIRYEKVVNSWFQFVVRGLDYIGITSGDVVSYFEAFYPEKLFYFNRFPDQNSVTYHTKSKSFLVLDNHGAVKVFPFPVAAVPIDHC